MKFKVNFFNIVYIQEHHLPDWQLIATAGSIESEANLLEMFVDVLPTQSSASALANATEVCLLFKAQAFPNFFCR